jgi:hypothetical protein
MSKKARRFRILARAASSTIVKIGETITIGLNQGEEHFRIHFTTNYIKTKTGTIPGDLYVVMDVAGDTLEEAAAMLTGGRDIAALISIVANAAIQPLELEVIYECTEKATERQFMQIFMPENQPCYSSRVVPSKALGVLITALDQHKHRDRFVRAIAQYSEALLNWEQGKELLALNHLWIGVEAMKTVCLQMYMERHSLTEEKLGQEWGFDPKRRMPLNQFLEVNARIRLTCFDDKEHHDIAKGVSDAYEHAFKNSGALYTSAASVLMPISTYLRRCILDALGFTGVQRTELDALSPRGPKQLEQYFRGKLISPEGDPAPSAAQPHLNLTYRITEAQIDDTTGRFSYKPQWNVTPTLPPGYSITDIRVELWDVGAYKPQPAGEIVLRENAPQNVGPNRKAAGLDD